MKKMMEKLACAAIIAFAASSVFARVAIQERFESTFAESGFVKGDSVEDESDVVTYDTSISKPSNDKAPYPLAGETADASFGSKYLSIDTGTSTVWRENATSGNIYFDMVVQFQPFTEAFSPDDLPENSKFAVYLNSSSNIVVVARAQTGTATNSYTTSAQLYPGTWARLTVTATNDAFSVRIDGVTLSSNGVTSFPFLKTGNITFVGFTGTGALDDFVARTTDPFFDNMTMVASIGGTSGECYASLAAAIADADENDVVELQSNNSENITLAEGKIFKLKCASGVEYTGTVTSYSGYRLEISEPDANGVVTYSQSPYKPSICINFTTGADNGLTAVDDVGLAGYQVPGTSWNNFVVANNATFSTVNAVDSTGAASVMSGVSVAISGTRGSYACSNLTPASNPLHGYIDENANYPSPTVTVTGIPYYKYHVLVYHSTDTGNVPFGYDTINGTNYTYENEALAEGTTAWGDSGAKDGANAILEGVNVLLTGELSGSTLTVVGHRGGGDSSARGCIAAIQIIEVRPEIGENDLEIPVSGDTTYTVSEEKTVSGTVYLTGYGTLTLAGSAKISSATIDVSSGVTLNVNADRLDATTYIGAGTVVYDGVVPPTGKGWTDSTWTGTVWIKNKTGLINFNPNNFGNSGSTVRLTGVAGYLPKAKLDISPAIELVDDGNTVALNLTDGFSYNFNGGYSYAKFNALRGTGTLKGSNNSTTVLLQVVDASAFFGAFNMENKAVYFGDVIPEEGATITSGTIVVPDNVTVTVPSDKTWTANGGFVVNGTLNANGTLASSHATKAVSGSGTVVFTGKLPSPTGDAWWKNSDWDGTVQVASVTDLVGGTGWTGSNFLPNDYGNSESVLELKNCSGWLPNSSNYQCTVPLKVTGTLTINNGISGTKFVISKLLGNGVIYTTNNGATVTIQVLEADNFTGYVQLDSKRVIFGETIPETFTVGQIYVGSGFTFTVPNSDAAWYGTGGITIDGELKATALSNFGGGTTITTTDNGVFTLITNSNADDMNLDYSRLQGTGTLKLEGSAYRCISTNNFPTAMTVDDRLTAGFLHRIPGLEITIGSLAGDGYLRSDWGGSAGDRDLRVLQAKDTTWSGKFWTDNPHRFRSLIVAPGATTSGTLTISATHVAAESTGLTVESGAKVNLTGTWVGATTVAGTFGGTGTLTGDLVLSNGAELKVTDISRPLNVNGNLTATGTIRVSLPAGAASGTLLSVSGTTQTEATFDVYVDGSLRRNMKVKSVSGGLKIVTTGSVIRYF